MKHMLLRALTFTFKMEIKNICRKFNKPITFDNAHS